MHNMICGMATIMSDPHMQTKGIFTLSTYSCTKARAPLVIQSDLLFIASQKQIIGSRSFPVAVPTLLNHSLRIVAGLCLLLLIFVQGSV